MASKNRFITIITTLLITGFLSVSLFSYFSARHSLSDLVVSEVLPLTSVSVYSKIKQDMLHPISIASLMAHDTFVRDWVIDGEQNPKKMVRYLKEIQDKYQATTSFFISESSRNYYHSSGRLKKIDSDNPQDDWYFRVQQMIQDYEVNVDIQPRVQDTLTIFINYRVYDYHGNFIGITGVGLDISSMQEMIEQYRSTMNLNVFFASREGDIILHGPKFNRYKQLQQIPGLADVTDTLLSSSEGKFSYRRNDNSVHINSRLINEFNWYLLVERTDDPWDNRIWQPLAINLSIGLLISALVLGLVLLAINSYQHQLKQMLITDKLTDASNRRGFEIIWQRISKTAPKDRRKVCALLIDIDHFKKINDSYGHLAGDAIICSTIKVIKQQLKSEDSVIRWGGEEFLILLPKHTTEQAAEIAEQIRQNVQNHKTVLNDQTLQVNISVGATNWDGLETVDHLIHRADKALYQAKNSGRNKVQCQWLHQDK